MALDLDTIVEFLNTCDKRRFGRHASKGPGERDALQSAEALRRWLTARGLASAGSRVSAADLGLALQLRDGLRGLLDAENAEARSATVLREVALQLPLTVDFAGEKPTLVHAGSPVRAFLADVLAACVVAASEGRWPRLKMCAAPDCQWVFHDISRNALGRWCNMDVCGNRTKTRNYRARKHRTRRSARAR